MQILISGPVSNRVLKQTNKSAVILGACGYRMLHKETLTVEKAAPRKPDIAVLDAKVKSHFDRARQNIPALVEELSSYSSMVNYGAVRH